MAVVFCKSRETAVLLLAVPKTVLNVLDEIVVIRVGIKLAVDDRLLGLVNRVEVAFEIAGLVNDVVGSADDVVGSENEGTGFVPPVFTAVTEESSPEATVEYTTMVCGDAWTWPSLNSEPSSIVTKPRPTPTIIGSVTGRSQRQSWNTSGQQGEEN